MRRDDSGTTLYLRSLAKQVPNYMYNSTENLHHSF